MPDLCAHCHWRPVPPNRTRYCGPRCESSAHTRAFATKRGHKIAAIREQLGLPPGGTGVSYRDLDAIAAALAARTAVCACGARFDPRTAYDGHTHGGPDRRWCTTRCRDRHQWRRRHRAS